MPLVIIRHRADWKLVMFSFYFLSMTADRRDLSKSRGTFCVITALHWHTVTTPPLFQPTLISPWSLQIAGIHTVRQNPQYRTSFPAGAELTVDVDLASGQWSQQHNVPSSRGNFNLISMNSNLRWFWYWQLFCWYNNNKLFHGFLHLHISLESKIDI